MVSDVLGRIFRNGKVKPKINLPINFLCVDLKLQVIIRLIRFIVTRYTDSNLSMVDNKTSIKVNQLGQ